MASEIHVVSKHDITKHTTISVELPSPGPLAPSSVRVRSRVLGITANNFAYAKLGGFLRWWDTYPVPSGLPAPYNDSEQWGIVPAWGYGEVEVSNVADIPKGTWLWGFWPTSSHTVDLKLKSSDAGGHYVEISEHRNALKSLYNAYRLVGSPPPEETQGWTSSSFAIWGAGYVLNRYIFPDQAGPRVHPGGHGSWTEQDADITSAVVVTLAATSKTGIAFAWNLAHRDLASGPLALLQVTSSPKAVPTVANDQLKNKVVTYAELAEPAVAEWLAELKPSRIVLLDFGGPGGTAEQFGASILAKLPATTSYTIIPVGAEPSLDPLPANFAGSPGEQVRLDTSSVTDAAHELEGVQEFHNQKSEAFQKWIEEKGMGDMELIWGEGIGGEKGVEKTWEDLCSGNLPRQKALAFKL